MRQQHEADDDAPDEIANHQLQEGEIGVIGKARHADDGEGAGFSGNDGERNRPPRDVTAGEKVIAQRPLSLAKTQSEERDAQQIDCDQRKIKLVQCHCVEPLSRMGATSPMASQAPSAIMRAVAYFLGIDGGGSNIVRLGESEARNAFKQGVREVCREAGIKPKQIVAICAGIAGAAREDVRRQVTAILAKLAPAQVEVVGGMVIAHEAALGGAPGIVALAGTGSIAYGRHVSGRTARAGGWGHAISDEGSGHWIGVQAVVAVTHAVDSGSYTKLSDRILQHWGVRSYGDLIYRANASPLPDFAGLFPAVVAAAEAGDSYAHDVLARAGVELAGLAGLVFRRLWKAADEVDVALTGGVFENSAEVRESFRREMKRSIAQAQVSLSTRSAAEGALVLARKLAASSK